MATVPTANFGPQSQNSEGEGCGSNAGWLTSSGPGEEFDACRRAAGGGAENTTEAQPTGGLGWGGVMRRIGEDGFRGTRGGLWMHWSRLGARRQEDGAHHTPRFGGACRPNATLPLGGRKSRVILVQTYRIISYITYYKNSSFNLMLFSALLDETKKCRDVQRSESLREQRYTL